MDMLRVIVENMGSPETFDEDRHTGLFEDHFNHVHKYFDMEDAAHLFPKAAHHIKADMDDQLAEVAKSHASLKAYTDKYRGDGGATEEASWPTNTHSLANTLKRGREAWLYGQENAGHDGLDSYSLALARYGETHE